MKQYSGTKVLVHYGGQSAERSGLLDKICRALEAEGIAYVKLGGVVPNPRLSASAHGLSPPEARIIFFCFRRVLGKCTLLPGRDENSDPLWNDTAQTDRRAV